MRFYFFTTLTLSHTHSHTHTATVPPSPPTILGAVPTGSTTISLQWTPSTEDGGSPLTNYIIEYRLLDDASFSYTTTAADTLSATIYGLTPYGQYEVRVRGENEVGPGDHSNTFLAQTHPAGEGKTLLVKL